MSIFTRGFWARLLTRGFWQGDYTPPTVSLPSFEHYVAQIIESSYLATGTLGYIRTLSECTAMDISVVFRSAEASVDDPPPLVTAAIDSSNPAACVLSIDIVALFENLESPVITAPTWGQLRTALLAVGITTTEGTLVDSDLLGAPNAESETWTYSATGYACTDGVITIPTKFVPLTADTDADTPPNNLGAAIGGTAPVLAVPCDDIVYGEPYVATVDVEEAP
jgi:hypothetical protein